MNELLVGIYENLKAQTQAIFEMAVQIQALEMALNTRTGFAEVYTAAIQDVRNANEQNHQQKMRIFDELIQQVRQQSSRGDA